jgi:FAD:protein FMN transferase
MFAASRSAFHVVSEPRPLPVPARVFRVPFQAMACACEVVLAATDDVTAMQWAGQAIAEVRRIEAKYSRYRSDSVVSHINAGAGGAAVTVDAETAFLLEHADSLFRSSGGLFDITSGVLRRAWNFKVPDVPTRQELDGLLRLVGWTRVQREPRQVRLPEAGMELDFGGFGKEYAADRAGAALHAAGADHGYVNLGGDMRVIGPRPDGSPWMMGIRDPRDATGIVATVPVERGGLATSGDYEQYFELGGRRYCHVLHPRTGWPVSIWRTVSVQAPTALRAGTCSTIAMLKQTDGSPYLEGTGLNFLAIDHHGLMHLKGSLPLPSRSAHPLTIATGV